jgi:hypothetical protein
MAEHQDDDSFFSLVFLDERIEMVQEQLDKLDVELKVRVARELVSLEMVERRIDEKLRQLTVDKMVRYGYRDDVC